MKKTTTNIHCFVDRMHSVKNRSLRGKMHSARYSALRPIPPILRLGQARVREGGGGWGEGRRTGGTTHGGKSKARSSLTERDRARPCSFFGTLEHEHRTSRTLPRGPSPIRERKRRTFRERNTWTRTYRLCAGPPDGAPLPTPLCIGRRPSRKDQPYEVKDNAEYKGGLAQRKKNNGIRRSTNDKMV